MKIFVTDKYTVMTAALVTALIIAAVPLSRLAVETASSDRELPIYSVDRPDSMISVTFDCAWGAEDADAIIAALAEHNCRATFFVLGTWAEKYPDVIKKLGDAGHEIAGHSYDHTYYTRGGHGQRRRRHRSGAGPGRRPFPCARRGLQRQRHKRRPKLGPPLHTVGRGQSGLP